MKQFRASADHYIDLLEYATMAYVLCIDDMIKMMIERGTDITIVVLIKAKKSYYPPVSLLLTT